VTDASLGITGTPARDSAGRAPHVRALIALELYVVVAYVAAAIIPYFWRLHPAPPTWTWIVPGWLFGVPGFWIALLGPMLAIPLALIGAWTATRQYRVLSRRLRWWCIAAAVLTGAYAAFSVTPLASTIVAWVAD
jgi:hypothetical protein